MLTAYLPHVHGFFKSVIQLFLKKIEYTFKLNYRYSIYMHTNRNKIKLKDTSLHVYFELATNLQNCYELTSKYMYFLGSFFRQEWLD
jgi:hypothetical protein